MIFIDGKNWMRSTCGVCPSSGLLCYTAIATFLSELEIARSGFSHTALKCSHMRIGLGFQRLGLVNNMA